MKLSAYKTKRSLPYLLAAAATFFIIPGAFYQQPETGFDPSWMIAIHLAIKNRSGFGSNFIFTFGPLAIFRFRYPIVAGKYIFLLGDLYFLTIGFLIFSHFCKRHLRLAPLLFGFCCFLLCMDMELEKWYFAFLFYYLFAFLAEPKSYVYLIHAAVLSVICLYIKVNSGVVDIFFFAAVVFYALLVKKMTWKVFALTLLSYLVLLFVSAWLLDVQLAGYISGSLHMIRDYNEVMYLPLKGRFGYIAAWGAAVTIFVLIVCYGVVFCKWIFLKKKNVGDLDTLFMYGLVASALFIWYKNGFVRADGHVFHFFQMAGPLVLLLFLYTPLRLGRKFAIVLCWGALACSCVINIILPDQQDNFTQFVKFKLVPVKLAQVRNYFSGLAGYDKAFAFYDSLTSRPNQLKTLIGDHPTDVVPMEISTLYFNGLVYDPRPGLQSYAAFDFFLDSLGFAKYMSPKAPDYVLYSHDGIDERFPWMDEDRVKLALINRYRVVGPVDSLLVLAKRDKPRDVSIVREEVQQVRLGERIPIKPGRGFLFTRFFVHYTPRGRLRALLYQPAQLKLDLMTEDNQFWSYRTFLPILADGIIVNKFVNSTREFQLMMLSDGRLIPNIKWIMIHAVDTTSYDPHIEMVNTWYAFGGRTPGEISADSMAVDRIAGDSIPLKTSPKLLPGEDGQQMRTMLTCYADHGNYIRIEGWAMREAGDNRHNTVKVILASDSVNYQLPARRMWIREFPLELRRRNDLDSVGFTAMISRAQLPPGNYRLMATIYDRETGQSWTREMGKFVDIRHQFKPERAARFSAGSRGASHVLYGIDSIGYDNGHVFIVGWSVLETAGTNTPTAIILQNDSATYTIDADKSRREDIPGVFKKPYLLYSGFSAVIPSAGLHRWYTIGILKKDPDSRKAEWKLTDRTVMIPEISLVTPMDSLPPPGPFYGNLESIKEDEKVIKLSGWALRDTAGAAPLTDIVLKSETHAYACSTIGAPRPDIAGRFKNDRLRDCGFSAVIAKNALPKGRYRVGLRIYKKGVTGTAVFFDKYIEIKPNTEE